MGCTQSSEYTTDTPPGPGRRRAPTAALQSRLERVSSERVAAARREREHVKRNAVAALLDRRARAAGTTTAPCPSVDREQGGSGSATHMLPPAWNPQSANTRPQQGGTDCTSAWNQRIDTVARADSVIIPVEQPSSQGPSATSVVLDVWRGSHSFNVVHARGSRTHNCPTSQGLNPLYSPGARAATDAP
uniref:Uncharacterized protein n=1 Tax=Neobodo designis TaxID=312471 RepID=A0A7S1KY82_NEODS